MQYTFLSFSRTLKLLYAPQFPNRDFFKGKVHSRAMESNPIGSRKRLISSTTKYLKTVPVNFVVDTVLYYYCVYYEIYLNTL